MWYKMATGTWWELPESWASTPAEWNDSRLGGPYSLAEIFIKAGTAILWLMKNNNSHQDTQQPSKQN